MESGTNYAVLNRDSWGLTKVAAGCAGTPFCLNAQCVTAAVQMVAHRMVAYRLIGVRKAGARHLSPAISVSLK